MLRNEKRSLTCWNDEKFDLECHGSVVQLERTLDYGSRGCGFDSYPNHD